MKIITINLESLGWWSSIENDQYLHLQFIWTVDFVLRLFAFAFSVNKREKIFKNLKLQLTAVLFFFKSILFCQSFVIKIEFSKTNGLLDVYEQFLFLLTISSFPLHFKVICTSIFNLLRNNPRPNIGSGSANTYISMG